MACLRKNHELENQNPQDSAIREAEIGRLRDERSQTMAMPGQNTGGSTAAAPPFATDAVLWVRIDFVNRLGSP
jgi:hypothetical protein